MKYLSILLILFFLSSGIVDIFGQKTIKGRIIDENFDIIPSARIYNTDTILLGETDLDGYFEINPPNESNKLIFSWIGFEWTTITIPDDCQYIEVILMVHTIYDFMSARKIDRLRQRRFDKLPELHKMAVQKGLFKYDTICYRIEFTAEKPMLDEIAKQIKVKRKQIKFFFKELAVGDTIRVPYSGSYGADGTERTSLYVYSFVVDGKNFDCIIEGVVIRKNKRKKAYNLIYRVTNFETCKYNSIVFQGKEIVVGDLLEHNMKYFKVLLK